MTTKSHQSVISRLMMACFLMFVTARTALAGPVEFWAPRQVLLGEPFLVQVKVWGEADRCTLSWRGRNVPVELRDAGDGLLEGVALLGTDAARKPAVGELLKVWVASQEVRFVSRWTIDVLPKVYPSEHLTVTSSMVHPPTSVHERIAKERIRLRAALNTVTDRRLWSLPFLRPVLGTISSPYGFRRIYNGIPRRRHSGTDFRAPVGTPVRCAASGRVILTGNFYYVGRAVYVDHGQSVISMYFHLSEIAVREGQMVNAGDILGVSGKSGRVTGPHLHFGVALGGRLVDPMPLLMGDEGTMLAETTIGRSKSKP
ncbi:MAG: peptidase M23 [Dethiosulfovibrio peptidovorans]|nr:MAG: peptidase M23 [Dethiosulfovibrio peptidovorans]